MSERLICFDLDGLYFTHESFQRFKETLAPNTGKSKRDYVLALSDEMKQFKSWKLSEEAYRTRAKEELWLTCSNQEIYETLRDSYEMNEGVEQLVKELRKNWYKTGVCTNNFPTRIRALDEKFHFLDNFDVHILAYEVWALKPDPKIFQTLIDQSWLNPEQIIYSDDKEENLKRAKSLWITTFVFHNFQEFVDDLRRCWIKVDPEA